MNTIKLFSCCWVSQRVRPLYKGRNEVQPVSLRSVVVLMAALLLPTGCSRSGSVEGEGTAQLTMFAAAGGLSNRQMNLQLSEVLTAATEGSIQIVPAAVSFPGTNLSALHKQTGAVVLHSSPDAVKEAIEGSLEIWGEPVERIEGITALFPIPPMNTYWVVSKLSGLTSLDDLAELDVAWLVLENIAELIIFEHYLNDAGLRPDALILTEMSLSEASKALRKEKIDGFMVRRYGAVEEMTEAIQSLEDIGIRMLTLSNEQITMLRGAPIDIPADTFAGQHEAFVTASQPAFAYANKHVSDAMAYQLVKSFWENKAALIEKAAWWKSASPALLDMVSTPFHPGALRYYREVGIEVPELGH